MRGLEPRAQPIGSDARTEATAAAAMLVGAHPSMAALRRQIALVAPRDVAVLILGESGVGKELVARELHRQSGRAAGPFVALSCCALSETLLESELFGHERGAFTGALARKPGRFELANGGTLFLDEIGDAPPATQAKLLRVLQERSFERVGGVEPIRVDVRIVAATNRDLGALRRAGGFREDLFHRLTGFTLRVPSLRERGTDVALLARALAERRQLGLAFSAPALARLEAHTWPGNVRELENALERLAIYCGAQRTVGLHHVELALEPGACAPRSARACFESEERGALESLLRSLRWNVSAAARELGLSRGALRYRLRKYGML